MAEQWLSLYSLGEIIGDAAARALCEALGGLSIYLPRSPLPTHRFVRHIGYRETLQIAAVYGGQYIALPNLRRPKPSKPRIIAMLEQGYSHKEIALECLVSERWVREMAAQTKQT